MQQLELESLLKSTQFISEQLTTIKEDLQSNKTFSQQSGIDPISYLERAIKLRQSFRTIADGIEAKKSLAQLQKEKIERSKNYIEGLQYYKTTLLAKIKQSQTDNINLDEFYDTPMTHTDWLNDYPNIEQHIKLQLSQKQLQKQQLQQLIQDKQAKEHLGKEKKQLYEKVLPEKARKLYEESLATAQLCHVKEFEPISGIQCARLTIFYEKIVPLRIKETIHLTLAKDLYEQLQITILKDDFYLYQASNVNKIPLTQKEVKITVASLVPEFDHLVIGLDRREDFTNEDVFQRLINNEVAKPVFSHPKNEKERNINAKYVRVDWLEDVLLTNLLKPLDFINKIKERFFSLSLVNFIKCNMKKVNYFFYLATEEEKNGQIGLPSQLKKPITGSCDKISFNQFLEYVHVPGWIRKYQLDYSEKQNQQSENTIQEMPTFQKIQYLKVISNLSFEELDQEKLNSYYKCCLTVHQNTLEFVLIVPLAYPQKCSRIIITNWQKKREQERRLGLEQIPVRARIEPAKREFSVKLTSFERAVNEDIAQFCRSSDDHPFRVLLQINRLISLLGLHAQKRL